MHHLSGLDASFLYLETPEQPMHVGGLNIYELPADYDGTSSTSCVPTSARACIWRPSSSASW